MSIPTIIAETINYVTYMGTNTTEVLYYYYDESGYSAIL